MLRSRLELGRGRDRETAGAGADQKVDQVLDTGMDRLHEVIAGKLGGDPALERP
ncbi:hypothetical protein ABT288_15600 [Streptomyces sp. NPDC001093]|uniref:hypothetical protein n=1 Tax=Streptomyces sp. NPDC001093 TaxID=3154376 RepID=UPI0033328618